MIVFERKEKCFRFTETERENMLDELTSIYEAGGRKLRINSWSERRDITVRVNDEYGNLVASLVGETATMLSHIYRSGSSRTVSSIEVDIQTVINKYFDENKL